MWIPQSVDDMGLFYYFFLNRQTCSINYPQV